MLRACAAVLMSLALTPAALAQPEAGKCLEAEFDSRSVPLDEIGPFAGASYKGPTGRGVGAPSCRVIAFYRLPAKLPAASTPAERRRIQAEHADKTAPPFFAARYVDDSRTANFRPRWTDQDRCPALIRQLAGLEPILAPKLTGDGPYRDAVASLPGGPAIRFWMAGTVWPQPDPDFTLDINMEGGSSGPFGQWLNETFKVLDTCWAAEEPKLP